MARMLKAPPPPSSSLSPLHVTDYSLPSSSRIPKVMIAGVAGFIVTTTAIFYICKWLFFKKCCDNSSRSSDNVDTTSTSIDEEEVVPDDNRLKPLQGLGKRIGVAIPTVSYSELVQLRGGKDDDDSELCAVCLTEFSKSEGSRIKVLPKCNHAFHSSCIDVWLVAHASCPVCRASLAVVVVDSDSRVQEQHQQDEHPS